jgi:hypothetical protein
MPQQGSWWSGAPAQVITGQRYKPEQQQTLDWLRQFAQNQLGSGQFDFGPIEQQARTGFTSKTVPSIMERFTSLGGEGTAGSSALKGALGSAGAGLEESLAAMRQQYNLAREPLLQNLLGMGLQQQQDLSYQPRQPGAWESPASALLSGLGLAGGLAGGNYMMGGSDQGRTDPWKNVQVDPVTGAPYNPYNANASHGSSGWQTAGNAISTALPIILKLLPMLI